MMLSPPAANNHDFSVQLSKDSESHLIKIHPGKSNNYQHKNVINGSSLAQY